MARYSIIVVGKDICFPVYYIGTNKYRQGIIIGLDAKTELVHDNLKQAIRDKQRLIQLDHEQQNKLRGIK